ncbi:hypothetical protein [Microbulbifer sp. ZKSA002]|uniref:hypothetical protein n=1 Tax=Microbulbifer sp. ZKSA002 TaxID=3243388 RepID=UPI00403927A4
MTEEDKPVYVQFLLSQEELRRFKEVTQAVIENRPVKYGVATELLQRVHYGLLVAE